MKSLKFWMLAAILFCGIISVQAQVMKTADLEKYAKQRYGDKWVDAAANIAKGITLDKNESITFQQVIEAQGKTKEQLYVALNYWTTATFKDHNAITLNDKDAGCIIISSTIKDIAEHTELSTDMPSASPPSSASTSRTTASVSPIRCKTTKF